MKEHDSDSEGASEGSINDIAQWIRQRDRERHRGSVCKVNSLSAEHTATAIPLKLRLMASVVDQDRSGLREPEQPSSLETLCRTSGLYQPLPGHDCITLLNLDPAGSVVETVLQL